MSCVSSYENTKVCDVAVENADILLHPNEQDFFKLSSGQSTFNLQYQYLRSFLGIIEYFSILFIYTLLDKINI